MRNQIELYINGQLVDLSESINIPLVLQIEDISNPGAIKTNSSKTVSLPSTRNNDIILDHLYKVDKSGGLDVYSKIPYELRSNNEMLQKGYIEFGSISIDENDNKVYELNLMSEEAEFFYLLSNLYFSSKTEENLPFNWTDDKLTHRLDSDFINDNWGDKLNSISDYLRYVPVFQGSYKEFNSKKSVLKGVGTVSASVGSQTVTGSGTNFTNILIGQSIVIGTETKKIQSVESTTGLTVDSNYSSGHISSIYYIDFSHQINVDEWSIKMFSSYRQKPAVNIKKIFESLSDYLTDYTFDFIDEDLKDEFFDSDYYKKTWLLFSNYSDNKVDLERDTSISCIYDIGDITDLTSTISESDIYTYRDNDKIINSGLVKYRDKMLLKTNNVEITVKYQHPVFYIFQPSSTSERTVSMPATWHFNINLNSSKANLTYTQISYSNTDGYTYRGIIPANERYINFQRLVGGVWTNVFSTETVKVYGTYAPTSTVADYATVIDISMDGLFSVSGGGTVRLDHISLYDSDSENWLLETLVDYYEVTPEIRSGSNVDTSVIIPNNLTVKDFFVEFCKIFNLYISVKDKNVSIKQKKNYFTGEIIDWSSKIDYKKERTVKQVVFDKFKYILGYKDDTSNQFLKQYKDTVKYSYGDTVYQTALSTSTEEERILDKTIFNPIIPMSQTLFNPFTYAYQQDIEALCNFDIKSGIERESKNSTMNIVFENGTSDYSGFKIFDDTMTQIDAGEYYFSDVNSINFSGNIPNFTTILTDKTLDFSEPSLIWSGLTYPENTISNTYWDKYISDRFNKNTKIFTAYFTLNISDINQFSFRKFVYVENRLWIVNKIEFDPTNEQSTKVELILVNDPNNYTT